MLQLQPQPVEKNIKFKITRDYSPEGGSQAQLREGFHLCSPRVEEEVQELEMQAGGQPESEGAILIEKTLRNAGNLLL